MTCDARLDARLWTSLCVLLKHRPSGPQRWDDIRFLKITKQLSLYCVTHTLNFINVFSFSTIALLFTLKVVCKLGCHYVRHSKLNIVSDGEAYLVKLLKPSGNYMYHLL
jgi:hypothetical protein